MSKKDPQEKLSTPVDPNEQALTKCIRETREAIRALILAHDCRLLLACILSEASKIGGDAVRSATITMGDVKQYYHGSLAGAYAVSKNGKPARVTNGILDTKPN